MNKKMGICLKFNATESKHIRRIMEEHQATKRQAVIGLIRVGLNHEDEIFEDDNYDRSD